MNKLLIFVVALMLTSCEPGKFLTSSVTSNEITELNYFEPLSYIRYIETGNKSELSDSLSFITTSELDSLLIKHQSRLRLSDKIELENDTIKALVENEIAFLAYHIGHRRKLDGIPLTPVIDSILVSNNQRFGLVIVATGFGRRKGNYGGQVAKGAAVGLLTLGMYVPTPVKSNLTLYAFIFDAEKKEVAFYQKSRPVEKEPTDRLTIEKELIKLFNGYFYHAN